MKIGAVAPCGLAGCCECSDDYPSMMSDDGVDGTGASTTMSSATMPHDDVLEDKLAALNVSTGDAFCFYDPRLDDNDGYVDFPDGNQFALKLDVSLVVYR